MHADAPFARLYSHEETGNTFTYERDRAVARWGRSQGVIWQEFAQFGVVRRLKTRNAWLDHWKALMAAPQLPAPTSESVTWAAVPWPVQRAPSAIDLGLDAWDPPQRQHGGRQAGLEVLHGFLHHRCRQYRGGISSPLSAPTACSRLSPFLSLGALSLREVVHATEQKVIQIMEHSAHTEKGLEAFLSRLHWHCHFIQKLESEPELEWRTLHRGHNGLREHDFNVAHFAALTEGRTGWLLVVACVAMLRETAWIYSRMRAMLVSTASYPLWLHWREVGLWLTRQFLDYEPGIHWSQMQMQAGTTGIKTTRVYNPIKQAQDHDEKGIFVRRWCTALRRVPNSWILEPWRMPESVQMACGVRVRADAPVGAADAWPLPLVDLEAATRSAKDRLHSLRRTPEVRAAKAAIVEKHGSRKERDGGPRRARGQPATDSHQINLFATCLTGTSD